MDSTAVPAIDRARKVVRFLVKDVLPTVEGVISPTQQVLREVVPVVVKEVSGVVKHIVPDATDRIARDTLANRNPNEAGEYDFTETFEYSPNGQVTTRTLNRQLRVGRRAKENHIALSKEIFCSICVLVFVLAFFFPSPW